MKVLITGGEGFVGSHLREKIHDFADVMVFDKQRKERREYDFFRGDITDYFSIHNAFQSFEPDQVFHLAGMVSRKECEETPQLAIQTNVQGTYNVCSLCKDFNSRIIYAGSSEEYGRAYEKEIITEKTPFGSSSGIYSLTKRMAEEVIIHFANEKGLTATTVRFFMLYGPGEPYNEYRSAVIRFIHSALIGEPLTVHRSTSRSWCYVDDAMEALKLILRRRQSVPYETFNIGRVEPIETIDLAKKIINLTGGRATITETEPEDTIIPHKNADFSHIKQILGWEAKIPLDKGLPKVVEYLSRLKTEELR